MAWVSSSSEQPPAAFTAGSPASWSIMASRRRCSSATAASKYDLARKHLPAPVTAMRLGELGWLFHPSELFSYYGLRIRTGSPLPHTLVVGYTDTIIGYLPDPSAYAAGLYEATVVPKILDLPPFTPEAARTFTAQATALTARSFT